MQGVTSSAVPVVAREYRITYSAVDHPWPWTLEARRLADGEWRGVGRFPTEEWATTMLARLDPGDQVRLRCESCRQFSETTRTVTSFPEVHNGEYCTDCVQARGQQGPLADAARRIQSDAAKALEVVEEVLPAPSCVKVPPARSGHTCSWRGWLIQVGHLDLRGNEISDLRILEVEDIEETLEVVHEMNDLDAFQGWLPTEACEAVPDHVSRAILKEYDADLEEHCWEYLVELERDMSSPEAAADVAYEEIKDRRMGL